MTLVQSVWTFEVHNSAACAKQLQVLQLRSGSPRISWYALQPSRDSAPSLEMRQKIEPRCLMPTGLASLCLFPSLKYSLHSFRMLPCICTLFTSQHELRIVENKCSKRDHLQQFRLFAVKNLRQCNTTSSRIYSNLFKNSSANYCLSEYFCLAYSS